MGFGVRIVNGKIVESTNTKTADKEQNKAIDKEPDKAESEADIETAEPDEETEQDNEDEEHEITVKEIADGMDAVLHRSGFKINTTPYQSTFNSESTHDMIYINDEIAFICECLRRRDKNDIIHKSCSGDPDDAESLESVEYTMVSITTDKVMRLHIELCDNMDVILERITNLLEEV